MSTRESVLCSHSSPSFGEFGIGSRWPEWHPIASFRLSISFLSCPRSNGRIDAARHISHHCVDSLIGPSLSSVGFLESVSSHFDSAPGPPRTCSFLASLVSNSESARGEISGCDGCSSISSNGTIEVWRDRALRLSSEKASAPCPNLARNSIQ